MSIRIPKICVSDYETNVQFIISALKENNTSVEINHLNWAQLQHKPNVKAWLGHSETMLFIYFEVENDFIRANCLKDNEPIWEDSCVEFFATISKEKYVNIEANCLGFILAETHVTREIKETFSERELLQIKRFASIKQEQNR